MSVIYQFPLFRPAPPPPSLLEDTLVFHAMWMRYWLSVWGL